MIAKTLLTAAILVVLGSGCGDDGAATDAPPPPADSGGPGVDSAVPPGATTVEGGAVSGQWCGEVIVNGSVNVPSGETLELCAGTIVTLTDGASIDVAGTFDSNGTSDSHVEIRFASDSAAFFVTGTLDLEHTDVQRGPIRMTSGMLAMTDSTLDLEHPRSSPDCTSISGGTVVIDHSRITGCHCPLHFNSADSISVTSSILDEAAYPVMIANATGTFTGNHFLGGASHILDIGGRATVEVSGNYWDGGPPNIDSSAASTFTGTDDYATEPFTDVGPR